MKYTRSSYIQVYMVIGLKDRWLWGPGKHRAANCKILGLSPGGENIFSLLCTAQNGPAAHQACCTMGNKGFLGVNRAKRRADKSPPSSAEANETKELFTARNTTGSNHCITLLSSWWWA